MKEVFICYFCKEINETYSEAEKHQKTCARNPSNRNCFTCKHLVLSYNGVLTGRCQINQDLVAGHVKPCEFWNKEPKNLQHNEPIPSHEK